MTADSALRPRRDEVTAVTSRMSDLVAGEPCTDTELDGAPVMSGDSADHAGPSADAAAFEGDDTAATAVRPLTAEQQRRATRAIARAAARAAARAGIVDAQRVARESRASALAAAMKVAWNGPKARA